MSLFSQPLVVLLIPVVVWLVLRATGAQGARLVPRVLLLSVLVLLGAGPVGRVRGTGTTLVLVVDQSRSMPSSILSHKARLVAESAAEKGTEGQVAVVLFGDRALVEQYPAADRPPQTSGGAALDPDKSNLGAGVAAALDLIPAHRRGRILIVSDGLVDNLPSEELLEELRRRDIPLSFQVFPTGEDALLGDIAIRSIRSATDTSPFATLDFDYELFASADTPATLRVSRDRTVLANLPLRLPQGLTTGRWSDELREAGVFRYSFELRSTESDPLPGNNSWNCWVRAHDRAVVGLISSQGAEGPIARMLEAAGLPCQILDSARSDLSMEKLSGLDALVLEDTSIREHDQLCNQLVPLIERFGIGLVVTGGDQSYGAGGYRTSPLEPLLPVTLRTLNLRERAPIALVVVADPAAWNIEGFESGELTPLQKALIALTAELDSGDRIGIVAPRVPDPTILGITAPGAKDVRDAINQLGQHSDPGAFPRAVDAAWDMLAQASQPQKHLLALVDASQIASWPHPELDPFGKKPIAGLTVTITCWGRVDQDHLALWKSRYPRANIHLARNAEQLVTLVRQDWERTSGSGNLNLSTYLVPNPSYTHPSLSSELLPSIDAFHAAAFRDKASTIVTARDLPSQPLIARWERGLGRVCAVLFDVSKTEESDQNVELAKLLVEQVRWCGKLDRPDPEFTPTTEIIRKEATVRVRTRGEGSSDTPSADLTLLVTGTDGSIRNAIPLHADDTRGISIPLGTRSLLAVVARGSNWLARCPPVVLPQTPEFLDDRTRAEGRAVLEQLAKSSGGEEWVLGRPLFEIAGPFYRSLVPLFAWIALALLTIEVADRRWRFTEVLAEHMRRWRSRLVTSPAEPQGPNEGLDLFQLAKQRTRQRISRGESEDRR